MTVQIKQPSIILFRVRERKRDKETAADAESEIL